ncbi:MAG: asparagine synthase (glutamine-hydrolyzing) [Proteobacteria bacterium]|nr:asparagine synthase (glutamine-hydrolyzing) [Pseudomonadota bacterium]
MCGVVGGVALQTAHREALGRDAQSMLSALDHRGGDGRGLSCFGYDGTRGLVEVSEEDAPSIVLGHSRMAIIDVSDAGLQPMRSHDGTCWISFNGEIYNYIELRDELGIKGHRFRTETDTDVLLAAYREWGVGCLTRLNGMYAFAVVDALSGNVLLARDPLGIKPLYYCRVGDTLLFASEIKGILRSSLYQRDLDTEAAHHYFSLLYVPHPLTLFKSIRQLPPAHYLQLRLRDASIRVLRYWRPHRRPAIERMSRGDANQELRAELTAAVRRQMRSDVPLGCFLSGGVDSTIVAAAMKQAASKVHTYTVTFPEQQYQYYDESDVALATSQYLGTEHHTLPVRLNEPGLLFQLLDHFDQPFGNPTYYLMHLISREARKHIKVALCGAGGDELFAGYPRHRAVMLAKWAHWVPRPLVGAAAALLSASRLAGRNAVVRRALSFVEGLDPDFFVQYLNWTYFSSEQDKSSLLAFPHTGCSSPEILRGLYDASELSDPGNKLLEMDVESFLVDNLLEYTDKMSMAVPIEVRVPFLDHRVVELALNIPFRNKLGRRHTKLPLREAFKDAFVPKAAKAPKRGFNVPLAQWIRGELGMYFEDGRELAGAPRRRGQTWKEGLLRPEAIHRYRGEHARGLRDRSYELFGIMIFDAWYARFLGG